MIEGTWRTGSDGSWYVACHLPALKHEEVLVYCGDGSTRIVTVIEKLEERAGMYLYDFERDDDDVDG